MLCPISFVMSWHKTLKLLKYSVANVKPFEGFDEHSGTEIRGDKLLSAVRMVKQFRPKPTAVFHRGHRIMLGWEQCTWAHFMPCAALSSLQSKKFIVIWSQFIYF